VTIRATRRLAEAWDQEVRRQVTLHGEAVGRCAVRHALDSSLGRPVLAHLERFLERSPEWTPTADGYRHDVEGGYVYFDVVRHELEIVAEVREAIQASGEGAVTLTNTLDESAEEEGTGHYYDDGYRGLTEEVGREEARRAAESALDEAAARRHREVERAAEAGAEAGVLEQATAVAQDSLAAAAVRRGTELNQAASGEMSTVGIQARAVFHQALANAYRDAVLTYARRRRAEGMRVSENNGLIDIEFEMEL
jgi:hypothetical protein